MQCKNGGWASFDKDNDRMVFQYVPFADHNAMLDPATVDITGRILEMLAAYGYNKQHPVVKRALQFIRDEQEPDGSWFGRWGVNYIYGTMQVLRGLQAMDVDDHEPYVQSAAECEGRRGFLRLRERPHARPSHLGPGKGPRPRGTPPGRPASAKLAQDFLRMERNLRDILTLSSAAVMHRASPRPEQSTSSTIP